MEEEPGSAVTVPPQSLLSSLGNAITSPAVKLSVNEIPVSVRFGFGSLLGLLMVKLNMVVPSGATVSGRKSFLIVGGKYGVTTTVTVAGCALLQPRAVCVTV